MHRIKKNSVLKSRNRYSQKRPDQSKAKTQQGKCNVLQFSVVTLGVLVDICCATSLDSPSLQVCWVNTCNLFLGWTPPCVCSLPWQTSHGHGIFSKPETSSKLMLHLHSFIQWPSRTSVQETRHCHIVHGFRGLLGFNAGCCDLVYVACPQNRSPSLKPIDSGPFHRNCSSPCLPWLVGRPGKIHISMVIFCSLVLSEYSIWSVLNSDALLWNEFPFQKLEISIGWVLS